MEFEKKEAKIMGKSWNCRVDHGKNHERTLENHGKIMEFDSGKLLGTLS